MKAIDIHGMTNMELVRGETDEWYWATDYIHGGLYEAEELFRQGHPVRSNRLYLIHYPDGTVYEAVSSTNRSHFDSDLCFLSPFARRIFRCFRPALPAFFVFWVKSGSSVEGNHANCMRTGEKSPRPFHVLELFLSKLFNGHDYDIYQISDENNRSREYYCSNNKITKYIG